MTIAGARLLVPGGNPGRAASARRPFAPLVLGIAILAASSARLLAQTGGWPGWPGNSSQRVTNDPSTSYSGSYPLSASGNYSQITSIVLTVSGAAPPRVTGTGTASFNITVNGWSITLPDTFTAATAPGIEVSVTLSDIEYNPANGHWIAGEISEWSLYSTDGPGGQQAVNSDNSASGGGYTTSAGSAVNSFTEAASGGLSNGWNATGSFDLGTSLNWSMAAVETNETGAAFGWTWTVNPNTSSPPPGTTVFSFGPPTSFTYDGAPQGPVVTTNPPGATYSTTGATAIDAGSNYTITATANGNYVGSGSAGYSINPAQAALSLGNLTQTYDGSPKSVTVTTSPAGLATSVTYNGSPIAPTNAGGYAVYATVAGNPDYVGSAAGTLTIAPPAFYSLSVAATPGGAATGGGSYPANAQATAVATPSAGNTFTGWTGDMVGASPTLLVLMNSSKSIMANFAPLLAQTISFVPPGAVSTRTPPFAVVATASSGLPVSLALDSGPATLAVDVVTPTGSVGEVTLTATQPGNAQYLPAPPVTISFAIGSPPPGVLLLDDSSTTKRTDKETRTTSFRSGPAN